MANFDPHPELKEIEIDDFGFEENDLDLEEEDNEFER